MYMFECAYTCIYMYMYTTRSSFPSYNYCVCLVVSRATKEPAANLPDPSQVPMPDLSSQPLDPDEPLYCHCQQVSFGEMIGCDNDDVRCVYNICRPNHDEN